MLRAIAIYDRNEQDGTFTRKEAAEKPGTFLIPNRDLKYFESFVLHQCNNNQDLLSGDVIFTSKREPVKGILSMFYDANDTEYYYGQYIPEEKYLIILISTRELFDKDSDMLFRNVNNIYQNRIPNTTLATILTNPIGGLGRDMLLHETRKNIAETKKIALKAKAAAEVRGEEIQTLSNNADDIFDKSQTFKLRTKDLEPSYTCCGGVFRNPFSG